MSFPFGVGFVKVNSLAVEPSEPDIRAVHPTEVDPSQLAGTDAQHEHSNFLQSTTAQEKKISLKKVASNKSSRPGRRGNLCCGRCRSHKNGNKVRIKTEGKLKVETL